MFIINTISNYYIKWYFGKFGRIDFFWTIVGPGCYLFYFKWVWFETVFLIG